MSSVGFRAFLNFVSFPLALLPPGEMISAGRKLQPAVLPAEGVLCVSLGGLHVLCGSLHACIPSRQLARNPISKERVQERP